MTLYEAISLDRPFKGQTTQELYHHISVKELKDPRRVNPNTPRDLAVIALKAVEKDPDRRYQSAQEMAEDLRRYLEGEPICAKPVGLIRRTMKRLTRHRIMAASVFVALALGFVASKLSEVYFFERSFSGVVQWFGLFIFLAFLALCTGSLTIATRIATKQQGFAQRVIGIGLAMIVAALCLFLLLGASFLLDIPWTTLMVVISTGSFVILFALLVGSGLIGVGTGSALLSKWAVRLGKKRELQSRRRDTRIRK